MLPATNVHLEQPSDDDPKGPSNVRLMRLVLALALLALPGAARAEACSNDVVQRADAPGGGHGAVLFRRDCGATTDFSTQVSVLDLGEEPSDGGNAFVADTDHGAAAPAPWGGPWAEVTWLSPDRLLVRYDEGARVFKTGLSVAGVTIAYEAVSR